MKLNPAQLEQHLTKPLSPVYFITGEELILKNEALTQIRKAATQQGFTEKTRLSTSDDISWDSLYHLLQSRSLMGDKKLIELDFRNQTPPKAALPILENYAKNPSNDAVLIIELDKLDDKITKAAWYKSLDSIGMTLTYWPITRDQLPAWLQQRAKKYKLNLQADAARLLTDYLEGNLVAATHLLEKIYLLKPENPITPEVIEPILNDESRYTVFDLVDVVLSGQPDRIRHVLETLKEDDIEPVLALWALTREIRTLGQLSHEHQKGSSYDTLFQKHRIFPKRQSNVRRFIQKNQPDSYIRHLSAAADIDCIIKGAKPGNPWDALMLFCLRLI